MEVNFKGVEKLYGKPNQSFFTQKKEALDKCFSKENYGFLKMEQEIEKAIEKSNQLLKKFSHKKQFIQVGI